MIAIDKPIKVLCMNGEEDLQGDVIPYFAKIDHNECLPLTYDYKTDVNSLIGSARLFREGNELFIDNIRLKNELDWLALLKMTPGIGGKKIKTDGKIILHFFVDMVGLMSSSNCDSRIESIEKQLKGS